MRVKCPTCTKEIEWSTENQHRPFCSKKCQLIDLGEWATEGHKISTSQDKVPSEEDIDIEEIEAMLSQQQDSFFKH